MYLYYFGKIKIINYFSFLLLKRAVPPEIG